MRRKQSNPLGRLFTAVAVILLCSVIGVTVAETASNWALKMLRAKRPSFAISWTADDFRKLYDTDDFQRYYQIVSEGWSQSDTVYSPFAEFRMSPHQGKYFTITEDGYRTNGRDGQDLAAAGPKVFIYGGSTAMGIGVADEETIAAQVEKALRAAGRADVQVFNFGVVSYFSSVVQLARHLGGDNSIMVREWGRFCDSEAEIEKVIARLDTNRRMIDATADRMGFKALFVQQPVPTYSYDNRKRPFPVKEEALGYHMNSARGYPRMAQMLGQGQLWERGLLWLAELEPADANAYIDTVHYSPKFNKLIADRVSAAILDGGLLPSP